MSQQFPPTSSFAGSNSDRQSIGKPGHCERCAEHGHVKAHPSLGCGDVGCASAHSDTDEVATTPGRTLQDVLKDFRATVGLEQPDDAVLVPVADMRIVLDAFAARRGPQRAASPEELALTS